MMPAPSGIGVEGVKPKNDKVVRSTNARSALQRGEMFNARRSLELRFCQ